MRVLLILSILLQTALSGLIGIDLGSEFFKVSLIRPGKKLVIVENPQSKRMTNNMISITKNQRVFGDDAYNQYIKNPNSIITYMNNLLGVSSNSTDILSRF